MSILTAKPHVGILRNGKIPNPGIFYIEFRKIYIEKSLENLLLRVNKCVLRMVFAEMLHIKQSKPILI